ncbi:MAG: hypothetical protein ACYCZO_05745 [Daejeonella sp.]
MAVPLNKTYFFVFLSLITLSGVCSQEQPARITILYDAFGKPAGVAGLARSFRDKWKIERVAAGHCTGQLAFSEFIQVYGSKFDHAGLGSVITLPGDGLNIRR